MEGKKQYPSSREGGLWVKQDGGNCCSILGTQAASANRKRRPDYSGTRHDEVAYSDGEGW